MPLDKLIRQGAPILSPKGDEVWVAFQYERLSGLCFHCGLLGHEEKACKTTKLKVGEESPYGEWLRAGFRKSKETPSHDTQSPPRQQPTENVPPRTSDSLVERSHRDGHPNGHDIDGAETKPQQTFNSGNGNCYHLTSINVEGNPDIMEDNMEVAECTKHKGYDINEEQYSDSNDGKNLSPHTLDVMITPQV